MRRRLQKFLPVVLIALAVQILAPIAASWAAAVASSDPLQAAEICHSLPGESSGQTDQHAHDGVCLICCAVQAGASLDTPQQAALLVPYRQTSRVVWHIGAADVSPCRTGSNTQARAPPLPM